MSAPALTPFAGELYQRTAPLAVHDAENDFAWAVLCAALATMFDPFEFVRDSDDGPGYSSLLDLDRAPSDGLAWLAMFAGVELMQGQASTAPPPGVALVPGSTTFPSGTTFPGTSTPVTAGPLSDAQQRARIDATAGFNRGTLRSIVSAAQTHLVGSKRVSVVERDGGDAYALRVITYTSETPNAALTTADVVAAKPAGLVLTMQVLAGWIISEMEAYYVTKTISSGPETDFATLAAFESRVV